MSKKKKSLIPENTLIVAFLFFLNKIFLSRPTPTPTPVSSLPQAAQHFSKEMNLLLAGINCQSFLLVLPMTGLSVPVTQFSSMRKDARGSWGRVLSRTMLLFFPLDWARLDVTFRTATSFLKPHNQPNQIKSIWNVTVKKDLKKLLSSVILLVSLQSKVGHLSLG